VNFLKSEVPTEAIPQGLHVVLDCANGATLQAAPLTFGDLGATVRTLFAEADGSNINLNCGSEHLESLAETVVESHADAGFAFDGDGDRVIAVDERGSRLGGDQMLAICAKVMKEEGRLANNLVVSTVMSNLGLGLALKRLGVEHVITQVGDRHVLQEMRARRAAVGGEDSGHMIFLDHQTTGDGIMTALKVIGAMKKTGQPLSDLSKIMKVFPQCLINVEVNHKPALDTVPEVVAALDHAEKALGEEGRVLVRYSGTQPMCRVMVEGPSHEATENHCREIAAVVKRTLN
jgi:phosphoglucosamine mutase